MSCAAVVLLGVPGRAAGAEGPAGARADRFLRAAADLLTDMDGPVGRVHFPVVTTNPNAGTTYGVLPVWLLTDPSHQIRHIIAPMLTYNETFGAAFAGTYYYYPTDRAGLRIVAEKAARSNRRLAARYEDLGFLDGRCVLKLDSNYESDGTPRFYGVGPGTSAGTESSYRLEETSFKAELGIAYLGRWQMSGGWRYAHTEVLPGLFRTPGALPSGVQGSSTVSAPRLALARDTRDIPATPSNGSLAEVFAEFPDRDFGGGATYRRYGGQWRGYLPQTPSLTATLHVQGELLRGDGIPLGGLAALGGPRSLRAFTEGRFQNRGALFANFEERYTIHSLEVVNARTEFQIAPFLDAGTVFDEPRGLRGRLTQFVGGVALRAVVKPTVVGRVEVGVGREGPAAFVGIDYPL